MRIAILAFAAGIWALQMQADLPRWSGLVLLGAACIALAVAAIAVAGRSAHAARALVARACLGLGFAFAAGTAKIRMADRLDPAWEGRDVTLTSVVAGLPQPFERGVRFEFDAEQSAPAEFQAPSRILLSWYNGLTPEEFQEVLPIRAGERWRLTVRLRRPHGAANPHGFDYEAALAPRARHRRDRLRAAARRADDARPDGVDARICARAYPRADPHQAVGCASGAPLRRRADRAGHRRPARARDRRLGDVHAHRRRTPDEHLGPARHDGRGRFAALVAALWRRSARLALRLPVRKAAAVAAVLAAAGYTLLAGFGVPAQRTLYMVAVVAVALWLDRMQSSSRVLAAALAVVLLIDPWAVVSPGFWLSFGAVALMI